MIKQTGEGESIHCRIASISKLRPIKRPDQREGKLCVIGCSVSAFVSWPGLS
ncbi:hypothetical protein BSMD_021170 [Bacillus subtilis Miyagi-4]|nr:hypothetical protein BSMD_021170 [Bacillus subtilis Miyagi-4]